MRTRVIAASVAAVLAATALGAGTSGATFDGGSGTAPCGDGTLSWSPAKLWPPNHELKDVTLTFDGAAFSVTTVTNDEEGFEKGSTAAPEHEPDFVITDATGGGGAADPAVVQLRAERVSKPKDGRTYTITVLCGDPAAGGGTANATVFVRHSRKRPA